MNNLTILLRKIELYVLAISGAALFITMLITMVDVIMRYFFHQPFSWWYDLLTNYLMIVIFYFGFAETLRRMEHLSVDALKGRIPKKLHGLILFFLYISTAPVILLIGYVGLVDSVESFNNQEVLAGFIAWPVWPTKGLASASFILLGIRCLLMPYKQTLEEGVH